MRIRSILFAGAASSVLGAPALAQVSPDVGTPGTAKVDMATPSGAANEADIVVTAQRRDTALSKTPVSVAVVTSEKLRDAQIGTEEDLRVATPGLSVRTSASSNQVNYSLRGQSQDAYSGTRPGVLPYINEVQVPGSNATVFYDLSSVQVLKGPQGTLFGRSATGGAVLFATALPGDRFDGYVDASYGNYNAAKVEGAVSIPLVKDAGLGLRLAGFYERRDGFQENILLGGREGDIERYGFRGTLRLESNGFSNITTYEYFKSDSSNTIGVISGLLPFTGSPPPYIPVTALYAGNSTPLQTATGIGTIQAFTGGAVPANVIAAYYNNYFSTPGHPATGLTQFLADQNARGPFKVAIDGDNFFRTENHIVTNRSTVPLSDTIDLVNIIGFSKINSSLSQDADGTSYGIAEQGYRGEGFSAIQDNWQISDELQLKGKIFSDRLDFVAGGYFADEKRDERQHTRRFFDILFGGQEQFNDYILRNTTLAGYAQGTFKVTDSGLSATAGVRYTSEDVGKDTLPTDSYRRALGENPAVPGVNYRQRANYSNWSWTFGLQQQFDNVLLYATTRRAYKSGGFNTTVAPIDAGAAAGGDVYDQEMVTDVELGAKFSGRVSNMPTRFNLALYRNWIENSQRTAYTLVLGNPASVTVNVPKGRVYGVESDLWVQPTNWLSLGGTVNYINSAFTDGRVNANGISQIFDRVPDTPEWSGTVFADVTAPVSDSLSLLLHGDAYGQTETFTSPRSANFAGTRIGGYVLANFRLGIRDNNAGWTLSANLKNAFNRVYYGGGLPTGEIYQINTLVPGNPRTISVQLQYKF